MAAAPLKSILAAEAIGAVLVGAALLVWTGDAATTLALSPTPPSWAIVRLAGVLLTGFGILLWAVCGYVLADRRAIRALAIAHAIAAVVLALQHIAIWSTGTGLLLAVVPLGLGIRYAQSGLRSDVVAPSAHAAPSA